MRYDEYNDNIEHSFEGREQETMGEILGVGSSSYSNYKLELLMDIKEEGTEFEVLKPGGMVSNFRLNN